MLAVSTTRSLALFQPTSLKQQSQPTPDFLHNLSSPPCAGTWSADNSVVHLASENTLQQYDPSSDTLSEIYIHPEPITSVLTKHSRTNMLIFSAGTGLYSFQPSSGSTALPDTHKTNVSSLALSSDSTLLASVSSDAVHVTNLTLSTTNVLKGLTFPVTSCAFHPHTRTRLLLACERTLVVYDTARSTSSGIVKKISMAESALGDICAITCSPFSKTLVALATTGGNVALVDLDKEKGLFRTLNVQVPLTTITFSPEGAILYLGTENGKVLLLDLRALDKPPKSFTVESGGRVQHIAVQKKIKSKSPEPTSKTTTTTRRAVTGTSTRSGGTSLARKAASLRERSVSPAKKKTVISPPRNPSRQETDDQESDLSVDLEALSALPASKPTTKKTMAPARSPKPKVAVRQRTISNASSRLTNGRSASRLSATSSRSKAPPLSRASGRETPSPDLPDINADPMTPITVIKRHRIPSDSAHVPVDTKGKGKAVEFDDEDESDEEEMKRASSAWDSEKENEFQFLAQRQAEYRSDSVSMQVSPRRGPGLSASSAAIPSPLRPTSHSAQEFLRSLVRDVMYEHQQETKAEMVGLHLDLIRAGRGWKKELREIMDEYMSDLRELREENVQLRKENEQLRRGY